MTGPPTSDAFLKAITHDVAGLTGSGANRSPFSIVDLTAVGETAIVWRDASVRPGIYFVRYALPGRTITHRLVRME